jgi:hypothetical protein
MGPVLAALLSALLLAGPVPPQPGPWHAAGAAVTSKPGKQLHFFRTAMAPAGLGVVARSSSAKPIQLHWWSNCEITTGDNMTEQNDAAVSGVHTVVAYPPVAMGSTYCYVSVVARVAGGKVVAAVFTD